MDKNSYYGLLVQGDLLGAIRWTKETSGQWELYEKYRDVFEQERTIESATPVDAVLQCYQTYYREAFYQKTDSGIAAERLKERLEVVLGIPAAFGTLDELEQNVLPEFFRAAGFHFMGGRTGGYYGPYIWRETTDAVFDVELPEGVETYHVRFLDGFIAKSWLDAISFGAVGTGGWTDDDGIIHCVKASYHIENENFQVSLLKHEAQHARDLRCYPGLSSEELEYRAKLVELIYSTERDLLKEFAVEAGETNAHALAARRIVKVCGKKILNLEKTVLKARELLADSTDELKRKYENR